MRDPAAHTRIEDHRASALYETDHIDGERTHIYLETEPNDSPIQITTYQPVTKPTSRRVAEALERLRWT